MLFLFFSAILFLLGKNISYLQLFGRFVLRSYFPLVGSGSDWIFEINRSDELKVVGICEEFVFKSRLRLCQLLTALLWRMKITPNSKQDHLRLNVPPISAKGFWAGWFSVKGGGGYPLIPLRKIPLESRYFGLENSIICLISYIFSPFWSIIWPFCPIFNLN